MRDIACLSPLFVAGAYGFVPVVVCPAVGAFPAWLSFQVRIDGLAGRACLAAGVHPVRLHHKGPIPLGFVADLAQQVIHRGVGQGLRGFAREMLLIPDFSCKFVFNCPGCPPLACRPFPLSQFTQTGVPGLCLLPPALVLVLRGSGTPASVLPLGRLGVRR